MKTVRKGLILGFLALAGCAYVDDRFDPVFGERDGEVAGDAQAALAMGRKEFAAGRYGLAVKHFRIAVNRDPDSVAARNGLGAAYDKLRRYDLAERQYRYALSVDPASAPTLNNQGYSYLLQRKYDLAVIFLRDAARRGVDESVARNLSLAEAALARSRGRRVARAAGEKESDDAAAAAGIERRDRAIHVVRTAPTTQLLVTRSGAATPTPAASDRRSRLTRTALATEALGSPCRSVSGPPGMAGRMEPIATLADRLVPTTIEVSNGTGRNRMAARMRRYLAGYGHTARWLSNARSFGIRCTRLFYRPGRRADAHKLAEYLPAGVRLVSNTRQRAALHLQLGADLLEFDRKLVQLLEKAPDYAEK